MQTRLEQNVLVVTVVVGVKANPHPAMCILVLVNCGTQFLDPYIAGT